MEMNQVSNFDVIENVCNNQAGCSCGEKEPVLYQQGVDKKTKTWDEYYFNIAIQVASNSKCLSRQIGAVLVKDKTIIGTGYNGPPRGVPHCNERWDLDDMFKEVAVRTEDLSLIDSKCPRQLLGFKSGEGLEWCAATHAEVNCIINSARLGISTKDTLMYLTCGIPCHNCMKVIINSGIKELILTNLSYYDKGAEFLIKNCDINVRVYDHLNG